MARNKSIRARVEAYAKSTYRIEPELLPFNHEDYAVLRHPENGKWFAVFFLKPRSVLGLPGDGDAEVASFKMRSRGLRDKLTGRPGILQGYPSSKWSWLSTVLDGTVRFNTVCDCLDESYRATRFKPANLYVPLKSDARMAGCVLKRIFAEPSRES